MMGVTEQMGIKLGHFWMNAHDSLQYDQPENPLYLRGLVAQREEARTQSSVAGQAVIGRYELDEDNQGVADAFAESTYQMGFPAIESYGMKDIPEEGMEA